MKKLIIVWLWVGIPLGWGVYQSLKKSAPLFGDRPPPAAHAAGR
jgi:hypothetical protein